MIELTPCRNYVVQWFTSPVELICNNGFINAQLLICNSEIDGTNLQDVGGTANVILQRLKDDEEDGVPVQIVPHC